MKTKKIAVIGLGYVGLPLAAELAKVFEVVGYDIDSKRIDELNNNLDSNEELSREELINCRAIWSVDTLILRNIDTFIVTVPTPITEEKEPDLSPLKKATMTIGSLLRPGNLVIYESTVYPGCTEGFCKKVLEDESGLKYGIDFYLGYSPERINPADKKNKLINTVKIVSACCEEALNEVTDIYKTIIHAGLHQAASIKVAEAAKIVENIQRDVNIALMNELSEIFQVLDIRTNEVLAAAGTKWNFLPFKPGLVGGHCIGVDPYYLIEEARKNKIQHNLIVTARSVNERVVERVVTEVKSSIEQLSEPKILILGLTFKENCPDTRNSKSMEIANKLGECYNVDANDPYLSVAPPGCKFSLVKDFSNQPYDVVVIAVRHAVYVDLSPIFLKEIIRDGGRIIDLLGVFPSLRSFEL